LLANSKSFLRCRSGAGVVQEYIAQLENVFSIKVQSVMADNGMEFVNLEMNTYLKSKGIALFNSVPYTPEQNGIAECRIQTLTEGAWAMLFAAKLLKHLWSAAIKTMAYLYNWSPNRANNGVTPLECLTGAKPYLVNLHVFGCPVNVAVPAQK
jgi:hypothetical protein